MRKKRRPFSLCRRGHAWTPENTVILTRGRTCKTCQRATARARYHRLARIARESGRGALTVDLAKATWSRISHKVEPCPTTGCWLWLGYAGKDGYGRTSVTGLTTQALVHRVSFIAHRGDVPEGLQLDHLCRQPQCCNPDHLDPVTSWTNSVRGQHPAFAAHRQQRCTRGHAVVGDNAMLIKNTGRFQCRQCRRAGKRKVAA